MKMRHKLNRLSENRTKNKQQLETTSKSKPFKTKNKMIEKQKSQKKTLLVTQLNCRGLNKNKIELLNILENTQADIGCLNETKLGKKNQPTLEGYTLAGYTLESKITQECITIKVLGLCVTNIYVSPHLEIRTDLITKIANEAHLINGDNNEKHPMFGTNDLTTNRTGKLIEKWLDEENYIIINNYECTHKDGGTLDVHLANPKLTTLFNNFYVFNESPSDHYPTVSTYNIDKPIESQKKVNLQKYKNHILHNSDDLDRNITNNKDLEKNIEKFTQKIQAAYKESIYVNKHIATNHQIKKLTREKHKLERKWNKLRRNDERITTQHQTICNKINLLTKEIKRLSKENTTRQQMKLIDKINQAKKGNNFWKAAKKLLNQNQKNNEQLPKNNQKLQMHSLKN